MVVAYDQVIKLLLTYSGDDGDYNDLYDALVTLMVTGADETLPMEPQQSRVLVSFCVRGCMHVCVCDSTLTLNPQHTY